MKRFFSVKHFIPFTFSNSNSEENGIEKAKRFLNLFQLKTFVYLFKAGFKRAKNIDSIHKDIHTRSFYMESA